VGKEVVLIKVCRGVPCDMLNSKLRTHRTRGQFKRPSYERDFIAMCAYMAAMTSLAPVRRVYELWRMVSTTSLRWRGDRVYK
jgi:hypothetical protein